MPISLNESMDKYTTHEVDIFEGDTIYMVSDGYIEQFGGLQGKKYMSKCFKEFLINMQDQTMNEQRELLNNEFYKWKGEIEQIDDVLVFGVRI